MNIIKIIRDGVGVALANIIKYLYASQCTELLSFYIQLKEHVNRQNKTGELITIVLTCYSR